MAFTATQQFLPATGLTESESPNIKQRHLQTASKPNTNAQKTINIMYNPSTGRLNSAATHPVPSPYNNAANLNTRNGRLYQQS